MTADPAPSPARQGASRCAALLGWLACLAAGACGGSGQTPAEVSGAGTALPTVPSMMRLDQVGVENGRGLFVARRDAGETRIPFDIPASRLAPERRHELEQVGETDDGVVVVLDHYASRAEPGSPRCADGRETFLRAFSLPMRRQILARQVESCLAGVPRTPVEWLGDGRLRAGPSTLTIADGGQKISESTGG